MIKWVGKEGWRLSLGLRMLLLIGLALVGVEGRGKPVEIERLKRVYLTTALTSKNVSLIAKNTYENSNQDLNEERDYSILAQQDQQEKLARLAFIHIPKTGGTSIMNLAKQAGIKWGVYDSSPRITKRKIQGCPVDHWPPIRIQSGVHTFCTMRDPVDRAISEVRYELWHSQEKRCVTAEELNYEILRGLKSVYEMKEGYRECHWLPQFMYARKCDYILRYESLTEDFDNLMAYFGIPITLSGFPRMMDDTSIIRRFANHATKECVLSRENVTAEVVTAIHRMYWGDLELLSLLADNVIYNGMASPNFRSYLQSKVFLREWPPINRLTQLERTVT
ncbi:hypothetical protein AAMO2058_001025000 [Amorphochlora amoebiformis]